MALSSNVPPPPPNIGEGIWYTLYAVGAIAAWFLTRTGLNKKPDPPPPQVQLSGALVTRSGVDPLMQKLDALAEATERLCDLMEKEVGLRQSAVDEERRADEAKRLALVVADQVREDILEELRREITLKKPAPMPTTRKT